MMPVLTAALVDAAVVLALGLAATALLRRRSASLRHAILTTSILMAALMPLLERIVPQVPVIRWGTSVEVVSSGLMLTSEQVIRGTAFEGAASPGLRGFPWSTLAVSVWILGVILTGAGLVAGFAALYRLKRRCRPIAGRWRQLTDELAQECGVTRRVKLLESDDPSLLISCGVLAPTIILPSGTAAWTDERKRVVLRHELAHIKRRDAAIQIGSELLRVVQWVNPCVWVACRRLRQESEYACDDEVLSGGVEASEYATHLLDVAKHLTGRSATLTSAHAIAHLSTLERRIAAMLHRHQNRTPVGRRGWSGAALLALGVSMPLAAAAVAPHDRPRALAESIDVSAPNTATHDTATATSRDAVRPRATTQLQPRAARAERAATSPQTGTIAGTVLDPSGGSLPGAELTLTDTQAGTAFTARTNASGGFTFSELPPSRYELVVRLPGFAAVSNVLPVAAGATVRRTITLPIGTVQETIVLACGAPSASSSAARAIGSTLASIYPVLYAQEPPPSIRVGGQIRPPTKTRDVKPACPAAVRALETTVRLTGRIGVDGLMNDVKPAPADAGVEPPSEFVDSALEAVRQWRFTPTQLNNQPVETTITVTVTYRRQ
jgi:beta-lactamase regulating signal transducer with metallopeptidase domain